MPIRILLNLTFLENRRNRLLHSPFFKSHPERGLICIPFRGEGKVCFYPPPRPLFDWPIFITLAGVSFFKNLTVFIGFNGF